jgi:hypothetical protein
MPRNLRQLQLVSRSLAFLNLLLQMQPHYKELILHNPWIRTGKYNFDVPTGKTYEFLIPEK